MAERPTPPLPPSISASRCVCVITFRSDQEMAKRTSATAVAALLCFAALGVMVAGGDKSIAEKCSPQFQKVTQCLLFVTAKAAAPSKECCASVGELKDSDPACLCYIIQQVHNSSNTAVKSMGLQETRLLQLPSACMLANASVAECPKLLNLPPNSPEAGIFTNSSTPMATPAPGTLSSTTPSAGYLLKPEIAAGWLTVAVLIHLFPLWPVSVSIFKR